MLNFEEEKVSASPLREWLTKVGWEMALAVALAAALTLSTGGTLALAIRYLAGFSGLGALVQAVLAVGRQRPFGMRLSKWDEAIALSVGSHLAASRIDSIT